MSATKNEKKRLLILGSGFSNSEAFPQGTTIKDGYTRADAVEAMVNDLCREEQEV